MGDPHQTHLQLRSDLVALNSERSRVLGEQCTHLSFASDGLIKAILEVGRNFTDAQSRFKGLISGSNVRTASIDSLFENLLTDSDPVGTWEQVLLELEQLLLLDPDADLRSETTPVVTRLGLSVKDLKKIQPKLTADGWLNLSLTPLDDLPKFEYRTKENTYIAFNSASAGQQATALLTVLLSQGGVPLLIDQPEEDLDSDTIQQIVSKIWKAKGSRQLIFASHNANLVVNGDADLVIVCGYTNLGDQSSGHIETTGAIDQKPIRGSITRVMEGGEVAFKLRKDKYGF